MQVGSLVELLNNGFETAPIDVKLPVKGKIYTIRGIRNFIFGSGISIVLEEIVNEEILSRGVYAEPAFDINRFRELLPPMSINISEIIHEHA